MSPSSEIVIELNKSSLYLRFVLVLYSFTAILINYTSLYWLIKFALILFLLTKCCQDFLIRKPLPKLKMVKYQKREWVLVNRGEFSQSYTQAKLLIHNTIFQILLFSDEDKKNIVIIFNDQIDSHHRRLLHLKMLQHRL